MKQDTLAAELREALQRLEERLTAGVTPLTPAQRATRPPDGGWCVDEILEHLCLANADYLGAMERALGTGHTLRSQRRWRASLGGWLLVRAMESERRTRAPAAIVPATTPRDAVFDALLQSFERLSVAMERGATIDWRRVRMSSPYARWLRLNFGDAALVVVRHAERHALQVERLAR
ncbi:MAG: DinB family protein [Gemmatimonadaceae bacterium]